MSTANRTSAPVATPAHNSTGEEREAGEREWGS
jgi:hypothetical protein